MLFYWGCWRLKGEFLFGSIKRMTMNRKIRKNIHKGKSVNAPPSHFEGCRDLAGCLRLELLDYKFQCCSWLFGHKRLYIRDRASRCGDEWLRALNSFSAHDEWIEWPRDCGPSVFPLTRFLCGPGSRQTGPSGVWRLTSPENKDCLSLRVLLRLGSICVWNMAGWKHALRCTFLLFHLYIYTHKHGVFTYGFQTGAPRYSVTLKNTWNNLLFSYCNKFRILLISSITVE